MRVLFLNPAFGVRFTKSGRWHAKSRGRVQRHPDYLCQAIAALKEVRQECHVGYGAAIAGSDVFTFPYHFKGPEMHQLPRRSAE